MSRTRLKQRANLRDVAAAAGVSVATVSRVMNYPDKVRPETRTRVNRVIEELRFVPSAAARAINSGRTHTVGALVPTLDHAIFARFLRVLEESFATLGLSLVVASTDGDPEVEFEKARTLIDIGVEGLIVSGITRTPAFDALVDKAQLPVMATSYFDVDYHRPTIGYDNATVAQIALKYLLELGHRDIAIIHGPTRNNDRTAARLRGLADLAELPTAEVAFSVEGGGQAVRQLLDSGTPVTGLVCMSDVLALGAIFELKRRSLAVPDAVSVVSVDDLPFAQSVTPALTTVHLPVGRMGRMTAEALSRWILEGERPAHANLETELVVRESTRPLSSGRS